MKGGFVVAIPRDQWDREYEQNIELGLVKPGETYDDYIKALGRDFGWVCKPS